MLDSVRQDVLFAFRTLRRLRGAGIAAVLALVLGVGATTAMFSVAYAALVRPAPFADADRLAIVYATRSTERDGLQRLRWSSSRLREIEASQSVFQSIASFSPTMVAVSGGPGDPEQIDGEIVSPGFFTALKVTPIDGRVFSESDDRAPGASTVAIVSERLWRRRFAADPAIVGGTLRVNGVPLTVIGIVPASFAGLSGRAEVWLPRMMAPGLTYADYLTSQQNFIGGIARLKDGVSLEAANAEIAAIASRLPAPESGTAAETWSAAVVSLSEARVDRNLRRSSIALLAASACVLLIACVNVASVLLARARTRRREVAIRLAIGSSRGRLVRQLLTEGLVLSLIAAAGGTVLAMWGVRVFARVSPEVTASPGNDYGMISAFAMPQLDAGILLVALATALVTTVFFGLAPALAATRPELVSALRDGERGGPQGGRRLLSGLVVGEVALAVLLLAGAALLLGSFSRLSSFRAGFVSDGVLTFWVRPPASRYAPEEGPDILDRILARIEQVPGVESAGVNRCVPYSGCARTTLYLPSQSESAPAEVVARHYVSPDYFEALGIRVRAGRVLTAEDRPGRPPVAVVSEKGARHFWPGESPIGKRLWFGSGAAFMDRTNPVEIVGVVDDVQYGLLDPPTAGDFYTSFRQFSYPDSMVVVSTRQAPMSLVPSLRAAVASVDPALPIYDVLALDDRIGGSLSQPRFNAVVVALFAGAALVLAALGVYGTLSYAVSARLKEMGVRVALGADRRRVLGLVLGDGLKLAAMGAALGVAAAIALSRLMQGLLMGVDASDLRLLLSGVPIMLAVAALAAFFPARRASAVDPIVVLRNE